MGELQKNIEKGLTLENSNPRLKTEFRHLVSPAIRAVELENELKLGKDLPFKQIFQTCYGDCHYSWQKPVTFIRQILALCTYPELLKSDDFPEDTKAKAKRILNAVPANTIGTYTSGVGVELIRKDIAKFLEKRDGYPVDYQNVFISEGGTEAARSILKLLNFGRNGKPPGVLFPVPQFPLYSVTVSEYGMYPIEYYLDEDNGWSISIAHLKETLDKAREHSDPRVIAIINPGNPSACVLTRENIEEIIKFAYEENLFILVDEVYQWNIYAERPFISFKKISKEMEVPYNGVQMASVYSVSKGYAGECGLRGGFVEIVNINPDVRFRYAISGLIKLCSSTAGQIGIAAAVNPPEQGEPSFELFQKETNLILSELSFRAKLVEEGLNQIEGYHCNPIQGSWYAFPSIKLPQKFIDFANEKGIEPDVLYVQDLLENAGIPVAAGKGFGQRPGTYHFRMTILPSTDHLIKALKLLKEYHVKFLKTYK